MGRVFILVITCLNVVQVHAQNLLLNGDFEEVIPKSYFKQWNGFNHPDYFINWYSPTDGTPDIYRSIYNCDSNYLFNIEPGMDTCLTVASGAYCAGMYVIEEYGYMEHLTGKLIEKMQMDSVYKIQFYIKNMNDQFLSNGFGYKLSTDSILFQSDVLFNYKFSPFYQYLFKYNPIYADFEIENYFNATEWTKITSYYTANGDEKYITFGKFAYPNNAEIIKFMKKLQKKPKDEILNIVRTKNLPYLKWNKVYFTNSIATGYYLFIDDISITKVTDRYEYEMYRSCTNCIDNLDHTVNIPNRLEFFVDKGFFGDLELSVYAVLKPIETLKIQLGKKEEILLNNESDHVQSFEYRFKYPASKVRNTSIVYSIIHTPGTTELQKSYKCIFPMHSNKEIRIYTNIKNIKQ